MARCFQLLLALLVAASAGCPSPSHPAPTFEGDAPPPRETAGEEEENPQPRGVDRRAVDHPFLYAVRNTEQPSYLLGTIHVGVSLEEALPGNAFDALAEPRVVLVELDPATVTAQTLADGARLPRRGGTLNQMVNSLVWHDLTEELSGVMASQGLRQMRPWFAMMMLTQKRVGEMHAGAPPEAMDLSIVNYAREQNIEVAALEEASDQIDALNAIPNEQMAQVISEMVEDRAASDRELAEMLEVYRIGDENRMTQLVFDPAEMAEMPEMYDRLFTRRNAAWLPRLKEELEAGGAFVAVGVGHLLGEEGLLAQLRADGYPVERVQ